MSTEPAEPEPEYPTLDDIEPKPRWRFALIVAAVCCVVVAGVAIGLVSGTPDSDGDSSGVGVANAERSDELPSLAIPSGCDLLTRGQVSWLVPGEPGRIGRGPDVILNSTESACSWSNTKTDPTDLRVQPAFLEMKATAAVDEDAARGLMEISLPCQRAHSTSATVSGADEACLNHKSLDKHGPTDVSTVSARYGTLVVEVSYARPNWPDWRVDDQVEVTAASLIGQIVQRQ